jgi:hypothetical protein
VVRASGDKVGLGPQVGMETITRSPTRKTRHCSSCGFVSYVISVTSAKSCSGKRLDTPANPICCPKIYPRRTRSLNSCLELYLVRDVL